MVILNLNLNLNIWFKRVRVSINLHMNRKFQTLTWMALYPASAWWLYVYVMLPRLCTCVYRLDRVGVHGRLAFYFRHCSVHFPHFLYKNLVKLFYHKNSMCEILSPKMVNLGFNDFNDFLKNLRIALLATCLSFAAAESRLASWWLWFPSPGRTPALSLNSLQISDSSLPASSGSGWSCGAGIWVRMDWRRGTGSFFFFGGGEGSIGKLMSIGDSRSLE